MKYFISLLVIYVAGCAFLISQLKPTIEKYGSRAIGAPLTVDDVKVMQWPPLTISVKGLKTQLQTPINVNLNVPEAWVQFSLFQLFSKEPVLKISLDKPDVYIQLAEETKKANTTESSTKLPAAVLPMGVQLVINEGRIVVRLDSKWVELKKLNTKFELSRIDKPIELALEALIDVNWGAVKTELPLKISSSLNFNTEMIFTEKTVLNLSGLNMSAKGFYNYTNGEQEWDAVAQIPELKSLPVPPAFLPQGQWSGAINAKVHSEFKKQWIANGDLQLTRLNGLINYAKNENTIKGPLSADADVNFIFNKNIKFNKISANAEMKGLELKIANQFSKPSGVAFNFSLNASEANNLLHLTSSTLQLANLTAHASGNIAALPKQNSDLQIQVSKTNLEGFEKYFTALSGMPLKGFVELKASLDGDLQNPENLNVKVNPLNLQGIRGQVNWISTDKKTSLKGPVSINAQGLISARGKNLESANITSNLNLTDIEINYENYLHKNSASLLKLDFNAKKVGDKIQITQSQLVTSAGDLKLSGQLSNIQAPLFNIKLALTRLEFAQLSKLVPILAPMKLSGSGAADFSVSGQYLFEKGIQKSPIQLSGKMQAKLPEFVYKSATPAKNEKGSNSEEDKNLPKEKAASSKVGVKPEPILPPWPIVQNMDLAFGINIGNLVANGLSVKGVSGNGRILKGVFSGQVNLAQIFSGQAKVENIQLNLLDSQPTTSMSANANRINIVEALAWAMPEYKDLAKGMASGNLKMKITHPSRTDFIDTCVVSGDLKLVDGYLSTLPFDKYANQKLSGIPGLGDKAKVSTGGVRYNIESEFDFIKSVLSFKKFHVLTPEKNELQATGWLKAVDKTMDLKGNAYLANSPVRGAVLEANADSSGRLIVPVHFSGNVMSPDFNLADDTIKQILSNTASREATKIKNQVQDKVKSEIQNRLQDELKKKFPGF